MHSAPLTLPEFEACLTAIGGFETRPLVVVGVSGGSDSMALMLLADRWARARGGQAWGLTVDHGLRGESADEARRVGVWLGGRGIPHDVLSWSGPKPESGIQAAAREARYRLLTAWCRDRCCLHLLTAHHLEDQIETHLIRRHAGSGVDGLAGMPAVRELVGCRLVRPLLAVSRERLAALLVAEGQPFLRDPSNLNPVFERARLRLSRYQKTLPSLPGERVGVGRRSTIPPAGPSDSSRGAEEGFSGRDAVALAAEIGACARARIGHGRTTRALSGRAVALHPAGFGALDPAMLAASTPEAIERLLSRVVACLGGLHYPPRGERLARLCTALTREPGRARTLGGCRFVPWRGRVLVLRELAAAEAPVLIEAGADLLWDRRFAVALSPEAAGPLTFGYLGQHAGAAPRGDFGQAPPPLVRSVLPAFWDGRGIAGVPHLGYSRPGSSVSMKLSFRPLRPLIQPSFTVV